MFIRKSEIKDWPQIKALYSAAREFMKLSGNPTQWGEDYPPESLLMEDISSENGYVCVDGDRVLAAFYFAPGPDDTYNYIEDGAWLNDKPYSVIHRFASNCARGGVGKFCIEWCLNQFGNIRIDTHKDNLPMLSLLKKTRFEYCGIIYTYGYGARLAFQKDIN